MPKAERLLAHTCETIRETGYRLGVEEQQR
jgi:hypothetical protein